MGSHSSPEEVGSMHSGHNKAADAVGTVLTRGGASSRYSMLEHWEQERHLPSTLARRLS